MCDAPAEYLTIGKTIERRRQKQQRDTLLGNRTKQGVKRLMQLVRRSLRPIARITFLRRNHERKTH